MGRINRRQFLGAMGASAGALAVPSCASEPPAVAFRHGVASGDPLQDRVILWTRATPILPAAEAGIELDYLVAEDPGFKNVVSTGTLTTGPDTDFTAKTDVLGLSPGKRYFYQFRHGDVASPTGRTRTLPEGDIGSARLAVMSCASFPHGYFNVYREVAGRLDIDVVVHLGDYIYEYDSDHYFSEEAVSKGRIVEPAVELTMLEHYRARHALYKSDPDLQAVHAAHPFIAVWDDHEICNDSYRDGGENHNEGDGDWLERRTRAVQAYTEWMPIRENGQGPDYIYRSFDIGNLASLVMLDTRLVGRDRQLNYADDLNFHGVHFDFTDPDNPVAVTSAEERASITPENLKEIPVPFDVRTKPPTPMTDYSEIKALDRNNLPEGHAYLPDGERFLREKVNAEGRNVLGAEQENWFRRELAASKAAGKPWQIIGQQIICGQRFLPDIADKISETNPGQLSEAQLGLIAAVHHLNMPLSLDEWAGYGAARARFVRDLTENAENAVVLSGDSHNAWAFDLRDDETGASAAVEFATPSVTSPGLDSIFPVDPRELGIALQDKNPDLKYVRLGRRGYIMLEINADSVTATWNLVDTVLERNYTVHLAKTMRVVAGTHMLEDMG